MVNWTEGSFFLICQLNIGCYGSGLDSVGGCRYFSRLFKLVLNRPVGHFRPPGPVIARHAVGGSQMNQRIFSLDILRGLAALMVLFFHSPYLYRGKSAFWQTISDIKRAGWCGVDLFFVLSGLLISGLIFKEIQQRGEFDLKRFWLRRGLKIWPSYYVCYGLFVVMGLLIAQQKGSTAQVDRVLSSILPNAMFIQNYADCMRWPCSWSLAIEEHFYFFLPPALLVLITWRRLHWLPAAVLVINACILAGRIYVISNGGASIDTYIPTHFRADSLLYGVLLGYLFAYKPEFMERLRRLWPLGLAFCFGMFILPVTMKLSTSTFICTVGFTLLYLGFGALVTCAKLYPDFGRKGPVWFRGPMHALAIVGAYSYTIYLSQALFMQIFRFQAVSKSEILNAHPLIKPTLFFFGVIAVGIIFSHLVERPFLALRNRWAASSSPQPRVEDEPVILPIGVGDAQVAMLSMPQRKRAA
jgi:peptidoglycan/LPS O-acetylase OafA/YrhL